MKIIETLDVTLEGSGPVGELQEFWLEDDEGQRHPVSIPGCPDILAQFKWLSDNDCLRHLRCLTPQISTNESDIMRAERANSMIEENAYAMVFRSNDHYVDPHASYQSYVKNNLKPVPDPTWKATWQFWAKDYGLMFKLAMGGK